MRMRPCSGFYGYYISTSGDVWSRYVDYRVKTDRLLRKMQPRVNKYGYQQVNLRHNSHRKTVTVHRLVCETFIGPRPKGAQVHHKDKDRANNSLENLEYLSHREHMMTMGRVKLTPGDVADIRRRRREGEKTRVLAEEYGVAGSTISNAVSGYAWGEAK